MMKISEFRDLIANLPVSSQAFVSKRSTWTSHMRVEGDAGIALRIIFDAAEEVSLSRSDLCYLANKEDLTQFIMATIIWGYPRGMRGNHVANLINHLAPLKELLYDARTEPVTDWAQHYAQVNPIAGIGLSTYTKFLAFLHVQVHGHLALILDDRIIRVANQGVFEELAPIKRISEYNAVKEYPEYLKLLHSLANNLEVSAEAIELFLFIFGLNLKANQVMAP